MTIRVFIVDDQALVRAGFRMLVDAQPDMTVVGEAADGAQAVAAIGPTGPVRSRTDVVLMDVRMPVMDGVQATGRITGGPGGPADAPKVLVLTTFDLDEYVFAALRAGASGFLLKDARPDELLGAIRSVAAGDAVVAPSATRRLLEQVTHALPGGPAEPDRHRELLGTLTNREREVLVEVAAGATNAEIATRLYMAEATVKTHIGRLLAKLHRRDRVGLVVLAYESGLVQRR
ncbi:response regulator [Nakamurella sp. GG22]